jgi:asparagine synthase (glutamine-hydrolysing)
VHGGTDKWILKTIAARHLPSSIVYRKKVGFPLPIADYLAPLARAEFFRNGFCEQELTMDPRGLQSHVTGWRRNVQGFFSLLALEIWGRMFFRGEALDDLSDRMLAGARAGAPGGPTAC